MKQVKILFAYGVLCCLQAAAQKNIPAGFHKGQVVLFDGQTIRGYIKNTIRTNAAVVLMDENGNKKTYGGHQLSRVTIDSAEFVCMQNDFFEVLCPGNISVIRKSSDGAGKIIGYNGTEPVVNSGTGGKLNDLFFYKKNQNRLYRVSKKDYDAVIRTVFAGCRDIIEEKEGYQFSKEEFIRLAGIFNNRCDSAVKVL